MNKYYLSHSFKREYGISPINYMITRRIEESKYLLAETNLSMSQIAQLLQVGQRTYCDYEKGKTRIPVDSLILLAKFYNVSMDYITGISDEKREYPQK